MLREKTEQKYMRTDAPRKKPQKKKHMRTDAPKNPEKKLYENRCSEKKKLYENRCSEKKTEKKYMRTDNPIKKPSINSTNIQ